MQLTVMSWKLTFPISGSGARLKGERAPVVAAGAAASTGAMPEAARDSMGLGGGGGGH